MAGPGGRRRPRRSGSRAPTPLRWCSGRKTRPCGRGPGDRGPSEDRIEGQQGITGKVHLGDQALGERPAEQGEVDVGGPPGVGVVAPRIGARLDGHEAVPPFAVGQAPTRPGEVGVKRRRVLIAGWA